MEHQAWCWQQGHGGMTAVDALAEQRMTGLAQVDSDLVGASGLEAAGNEGGAGQQLDGFDVGDGFDARIGQACRASQAVAAVGDEAAAEGLRFHGAVGEREVAPLDGMEAHLVGEVALGGQGAREHEKAGGFLVDAMYDAEVAGGAVTSALGGSIEPCAHQVAQAVAFSRLIGHRGNPGRLSDDHDVGVDVGDRIRIQAAAGGSAGRVHAQLDGVVSAEHESRILDDLAVHEDFAGLDEGSSAGPGHVTERLAEESIEPGAAGAGPGAENLVFPGCWHMRSSDSIVALGSSRKRLYRPEAATELTSCVTSPDDASCSSPGLVQAGAVQTVRTDNFRRPSRACNPARGR